MKHLSFLLLLFSAKAVFAQDAPAPAYLTRQDFPDSVQSLRLLTLKGQRTTFREVLKMYKGKKIVIDVWGSWCRDCIVGYPKLEALQKDVKADNIVFVFLSTDKEKQKWKNAIDRFHIRGDHYIMDGAWRNPLCNYLVLDWVPRYLVLDENGKVIVPKAVHAEDPALKEALSDK
jgi:thiol-disulfide isomerase/thioredoxin